MHKEEMSRLFGIPEDERFDEEYWIALPYSDLRDWIYTNDTLFQATNAFPSVHRLFHIKALSSLTYTGDDPWRKSYPEFRQDRFVHTLVAAKTAEEIARQNNLPKRDVNTVVTATVLHDDATPAYGDATKSIDPENLHEETHWREMVDDRGWAFIQKIGSNAGEIDSIIKNQGVLGQILDISDRITYVMTDLNGLFGLKFPGSYLDEDDLLFSEVLSQDPKIGNIYKEVAIEDDQVFFTNPQRLQRFLYLRALLHDRLYQQPQSQGRDLAVARLIQPFYSTDTKKENKLTPQILRVMTDYDLLRFLLYKYDLDEKSYLRFSMDFARFRPEVTGEFATYEDALMAEQRLRQDPEKVVIGIRERKGFNPATSWKVRDHDGQLVSLHDFDPEGSHVIEDIATRPPVYYLYVTPKQSEFSIISTMLEQANQLQQENELDKQE